jgi:hypothetical protein
LGVSSGSFIHQKAIEAYDSLVPYAVICKEYHEFGREVREAKWKELIKMTSRTEGDASEDAGKKQMVSSTLPIMSGEKYRVDTISTVS